MEWGQDFLTQIRVKEEKIETSLSAKDLEISYSAWATGRTE